ncbi:MAG: type II secretion system protein [Rhabdochlamydiaceae bacterium]|nr:type II secretion system protein [Candidatus Amphrikana amoebophyrae]
MSNLKKKRAFIIVEILIAFSIVGIVLTGFYTYFTYLTKSQIASLHQTRSDLQSEQNFISALSQLTKDDLRDPNKIDPIFLNKIKVNIREKKRKFPSDGSIVQDIQFKFYSIPIFKKDKSKLIYTYPLLVIQTQVESKTYSNLH